MGRSYGRGGERGVAGAEEAYTGSRSHEKPANNGKIERVTLKMDNTVYILDDSVVDKNKAGSSIVRANSFLQIPMCKPPRGGAAFSVFKTNENVLAFSIAAPPIHFCIVAATSVSIIDTIK